MPQHFLTHEFSPADRAWLTLAANQQPFDPREARAQLHSTLPADFNQASLDRRFYQDGALTMLGLRVFDPSSPIIPAAQKILLSIKNKILADNKLDSLTIDEIAGLADIDTKTVRDALTLLLTTGVGFFNGTGTGADGRLSFVSFQGPTGYDGILRFDTLDSTLQRAYEMQDPNQAFARFAVNYASSNNNPPDAAEGVNAPRKRGSAFVIMAIDPNKPELEDVLNAIKDACAAFLLVAYRADEIPHQDVITDVVLDQIRDCELLIADLSLERPNVYYEVGFAHALKKKPILFRRTDTKLHFDLSVHNVPEYRNATDLKEQLRKRLEAVLGRGPSAI